MITDVGNHFVLACRILCAPVLTVVGVKKADLLLLNFCKKVELLYGKDEITPNMHLHCHLTECVEEYGSIFAFWLFSFERYNGMLGNFPNNQKKIEMQLMRHFETEMQLHALPLPEVFRDEFIGLLNTRSLHCGESQTRQGNISLYHLSNCNLQEAGCEVTIMFRNSGTWKFPSRWTMHLLDSSELVCISRALRHIFIEPGFIPSIDNLPKVTKCYKHIEYRAELFSVYNDTKYGRHSHILAKWANEGGDIDTDNTCGLRPGQIKRIFQYKFTGGDAP